MEEYKVSITWACCLMEIHKSYYYYESRKDDSGVEETIRAKAVDSSVGFWKIFDSLRNDGCKWNHKRVPLRRRLPARVKNPLVTLEDHNITWSMDFVTDTVQSGRKFRVLNVIDDSDRVAVAQMVAPSMPAERVIRYLEEVIWENGRPDKIRCGNGPEFVSHIFQDWSP